MKKILIINTPCNGFGDIIFGWKIAKYLREWYGNSVDVKIATTLPESLMKLGEDEKYILKLKSKSESTRQCRRLSRLTLTTLNDVPIVYPNYDIYLVAPLQADFSPNYADIKKVFKNSNKSNTFFFSEYNDNLKKGFDFNTGVGSKRLGLLFTDNSKDVTSDSLDSYNLVPDNYAVAYIAETIVNSKNCYTSFFDMLSKKYKNKDFQIVCPEWIATNLINNKKNLEKLFFNNYNQVKVSTKNNNLIAEGGKGKGTLHIRGDILPVSNNIMVVLMKYSVKDILLTGDQSITDALSCCEDKNIFYQIAPWKENFGKNLSKHLPNRFLKTKKTSCGTIHAIKYKSNYKQFVRDWDFRKLSKPLFDKIIL